MTAILFLAGMLVFGLWLHYYISARHPAHPEPPGWFEVGAIVFWLLNLAVLVLLFYGESQSIPFSALLVAFSALLIANTLSFHSFAYHYAGNITIIVGHDRWVKALDYPYLILGVLGLVGLIARAPRVSGLPTSIEMLGPIALSFAIAIRLTKTSIEYFNWHKRVRM